MTGAGTLLGSMTVASLGSIRRRGLVLVWCIVTWGILTILFAQQTSLVPALLLVGLPGVNQFMFAGLAQVLLQTRAPDNMRGRAVSFFSITVNSGMGQLGALVLGAAGSVIGVDSAIAIGGIVLTVVGLYALLRVPALRQDTELRPDRPMPARTGP
jgi:sugar phosphate permease